MVYLYCLLVNLATDTALHNLNRSTMSSPVINSCPSSGTFPANKAYKTYPPSESAEMLNSSAIYSPAQTPLGPWRWLWWELMARCFNCRKPWIICKMNGRNYGAMHLVTTCYVQPPIWSRWRFFLKSVIWILDLAALLATDGLMHFRMFYHPEQYF